MATQSLLFNSSTSAQSPSIIQPSFIYDVATLASPLHCRSSSPSPWLDQEYSLILSCSQHSSIMCFCCFAGFLNCFQWPFQWMWCIRLIWGMAEFGDQFSVIHWCFDSSLVKMWETVTVYTRLLIILTRGKLNLFNCHQVNLPSANLISASFLFPCIHPLTPKKQWWVKHVGEEIEVYIF